MKESTARRLAATVPIGGRIVDVEAAQWLIDSDWHVAILGLRPCQECTWEACYSKRDIERAVGRLLLTMPE